MRLTEGGGGFGVQYLTPDLSSALDRQNELERQRQALLAAQRVLDRQQANMAQQDQVFAPAPAPQQGPPVPPGFGAPSPGIDYSAQPVQGPPLPPHFNAPLTGSDFQPSQSPNGILSTNFSSPPRAPFTPAIADAVKQYDAGQQLTGSDFPPSNQPNGIFTSDIHPAADMPTQAAQFMQQNPGVPNPNPAVQTWAKSIPQDATNTDFLTGVIEGSGSGASPAGFGQGNFMIPQSLHQVVQAGTQLLRSVLPPEAIQGIRNALPSGIGGPVADVVAGATSPAGILSAGFLAPETTAAIAAKSVVGGVAGHAIDYSGMLPRLPLSYQNIGEMTAPLLSTEPLTARLAAGASDPGFVHPPVVPPLTDIVPGLTAATRVGSAVLDRVPTPNLSPIEAPGIATGNESMGPIVRMGSSGQEIPHAAVGPMAGGAADVPPTPPENVPPPISGTVPAEAPNVGNPVLPDPGAGNPNLADSGNVPSGGTEPASTSVGGVANNVPGEPSAPSTASTSPLDRPGYKPLGTPGGAEPPPDIGGTPLESGTRKTIQALTQSRENIATTEAARTIEKGQRIAAADAASRAALAAGKTPAEAQALSEAALAGKYTAGIAADAALTPEEVSAMAGKINTFDFGRGPTTPDFNRVTTQRALLKLFVGQPLQNEEVNKLEQVFGAEFGTAIRQAQRGGTNLGLLGKAYDASQLIKQLALAGHIPHLAVEMLTEAPTAGPVGTWQAIADAIKGGFGGDAVAQGIDQANRFNPKVVSILMPNGETVDSTLGQVMQDYGGLRSLDVASSAASEEAHGPQLITRIPILGSAFKVSNRAFVSFDNSLGTAATDNLLEHAASLSPTGAIPADRVQAIVNLVNRMRLRGSIEGDIKIPLTNVTLDTIGGNKLTAGLETVMWTPRMTVAPVENVLQLLHPDGFIRVEAAKQLAKMTAAGVSLMALAKYGLGADVGLAPNADFGKIVVGNTHINVWGPQQRIARAIYQIGSGQDPSTIAGRFAQASLNPLTSLALDLFQGKDYLGNPVGLNSAAHIQQLIQDRAPISAKNIYDAFHAAWQDPSLTKIGAAVGTAPLAVLGGRVETYPNPRGDFNSAFKAATGNDYTGSPSDIATVHADPKLLAMQQAAQSPGSVDFHAKEAALEQPKTTTNSQGTNLTGLAAGVIAGDPAAAANFKKALTQYFDYKRQLTADTYPGQAPAGTNPLVDAYYAIQADDPKYMNATTGVIDWNAYNADRATALAALSPTDQAALLHGSYFSDPGVQQAYDAKQKSTQLLQAAPQVYAGPGITAARSTQIQGLTAQASAVSQAMLQAGLGQPSDNNVVAVLAKQAGDPRLALDYKNRAKNYNPAYETFLSDNKSILSTFYPYYYDSAAKLRLQGVDVPTLTGAPPKPPAPSAPPKPPTRADLTQQKAISDYLAANPLP